MSYNLPRPKPEADPSLRWCLENGPGLREYLKCARALANLVPVFTVNGTTSKYPIGWSEVSATINLEKFAVLDPLTVIWRDTAIAEGGTFEPDSIALANAQARAIRASTFFSKIVYYLPLLGGNLATARTPLINTLGVAPAVNFNFVEADFTQATGLQGDGLTKYLDTLIKPSQLGASNNGGALWWETNVNTASDAHAQVMGESNNVDTQFALHRLATAVNFYWGGVTSYAHYAAAATNGDYYCQRASSSSRELFLNGTSVAANTAADTNVDFNHKIFLFTVNYNDGFVSPAAARCGCYLATDGTLSATEVAALHTLLQTYLIAPTGR